MYLQCRHVRTSSDRCHAAAIKGRHWCYFHARLHDQQNKREAQDRARRSYEASRKPRLADGTFAPPEETIDQDTYLVPAPQNRVPHPDPEQREGEGWEVTKAGSATNSSDFPLELPAVEDSASIQLALVEVLQALAANQLDPRRAGLLLYGLQVASANAKNVHVHANSIRSISYTSEGIPLATQEHGWDVEDIEEADCQAEEDEE